MDWTGVRQFLSMNQALNQPRQAEPPSRVPFTSLALTILVLFLVISSSIGFLWLQRPLLTESTDPRSDASIDSGVVLLSTSPAAGTTLNTNQQAKVDINLNTQGQAAREIELVFHAISATTDNLNLQTYSNYNLEVTQQEIEATADGFLISYKAKPKANTVFNTTSAQPVLSIIFTPIRTGTFKIAFDVEKSKVFKVNTANPEDILRTFGVQEYTVRDNPDQNAKSCNESCSTNSDCAVNHRCYENRCRLVTNVSSESCSQPTNVDTGRICNEDCGSNSDCRAGLSCFENKCRRPENPDSSICALSSSQQATAIAENCNQYCTDNRGCAANLRCYNNYCRLATNTSSTSCSPMTQRRVSEQYYPFIPADTGSKGAEVTPPPTPRTSTLSGTLASPSPTSSASATPLYSPYVIPSPQTVPTTTTSSSPLAGIRNFFLNLSSNAGRLILIVLGVGALLLVIALLMMLTRRGGSNTPGSKPGAPGSGSNYEKELQTKIEQLKKQPSAGQTPTTPPSGAAKASSAVGNDLLPPAPTLQAKPSPVASYLPTQPPRATTPVAPTPVAQAAKPIAAAPQSTRPAAPPVTTRPPAPVNAPIAPARPVTPPTIVTSSSRPVGQPAPLPTRSVDLPITKPAPKPVAQAPAKPVIQPPRPASQPPKPASKPITLPIAPSKPATPVKPAAPASKAPVARPSLPPNKPQATLPPKPQEAELPARASQPAPKPIEPPKPANPASRPPSSSTMMERIKSRGITPPKPQEK